MADNGVISFVERDDSPNAPSTGKLSFYAKTDGQFYVKDDEGNERGIKGDSGIAGVKGDTGVQGLKGDTGIQGATGTIGTDENAIHDNVAGEVNALTSVVPTLLDVALIEDQSDSWNKKKVTINGILGLGAVDPTAIHRDVSGEINVLTEKTTLAVNDLLIIEDSAASNAKKRITRSTLQTNLSIAGSQVTGWLETTTGIGIRVYRSTDQSLTNNAWTAITLDTISWESKNPTMATQWSSGAANNIYCKKAGVYICTASLCFSSNASGIRAIAILKNGTTIAQDVRTSPAGNANINVSVIWYMAVQDYFSFAGYQNSGGNLSTLAAGGFTYLEIAKLG